MTKVAKAVALFSALIVAGVLAIYLPLELKIRSEVSRKIDSALAAHYKSSRISIIEEDKGPMHSVCLALAIQSRGRAEAKRFAMVQGDMDGGVWKFAREYASMSQCQKDYLIGG